MAVEYRAPVREMQFLIHEVVSSQAIAGLPGHEEFGADLTEVVLEEAARLANEQVSPLHEAGDRQPAVRHTEGRVTTTPGFADAYRQLAEGGWTGLAGDPEYGGQGLPELLSTAVSEMWQSACMSFALCPMLTAGAISAIAHHGNSDLQQRFLPRLVSGEWTGTMNLTEPQAGSDLAAVTTKAIPQADGTYRIYGTKIYITYGDHDLTDNIVHLVLARLPDAPAGVKGISLFVVPKRLVNDDGTLGELNDVQCVSLEHKLGIHGSPTAVMQYGDHGGAVGLLVGEANRGLEYMFTMMNHARLQVGLQGVSVAERAMQQADWYARDRIQGRIVGRGADRLPIAHHPDVRRMLASMKCRLEAMRAVCYEAAAAYDLAAGLQTPEAQARVDFLIPIAKAWCTEEAQDICSLGLQVHGGMGYVEETGAAQMVRDARIITIYEGTTAIQANDFLGRKLLKDQGAELGRVLAEIRVTAAQLSDSPSADLAAFGGQIGRAADALQASCQTVMAQFGQDAAAAFHGSVPLLMLAGRVVGGWMMGRQALAAEARLVAGEGDADFYKARRSAALYYGHQMLPLVYALQETLHTGSEAMLQAESFTARMA